MRASHDPRRAWWVDGTRQREALLGHLGCWRAKEEWNELYEEMCLDNFIVDQLDLLDIVDRQRCDEDPLDRHLPFRWMRFFDENHIQCHRGELAIGSWRRTKCHRLRTNFHRRNPSLSLLVSRTLFHFDFGSATADINTGFHQAGPWPGGFPANGLWNHRGLCRGRPESVIPILFLESHPVALRTTPRCPLRYPSLESSE